MRSKILWPVLGSFGLLLGIFFVLTKIYRNSEIEQYNFKAQADFRLFVPDHAIRKGNSSSKVFVVEFFDPECESCREFHPYLSNIMSEFGRKIQLILRYAPFHANSHFAISILEAARKQNKYWEVLELLYQHQPEWGNHHNPRPELIWTYLPKLGIDMAKLKMDMNDPFIQQLIMQDQKDAISLNVRQTPTFFVNGKPLYHFGPDHLKQLIEDELKLVE
jgi:protein-disulfide isomerase